jgi:hypothetical protein
MVRSGLRGCLLLLVAFGIQACTGHVNVPPVAISSPIGMEPVPGKYAAWVQSGGWKLDVKSSGYVCGAWSFDTDINTPYRSAMQEALTRGLQKVDFVETTLSPDDLKKQGYDAQVILYQGNARAQFGVSENLFSGTAGSGVELTSTMAVIRQQGLAYQATISGQGSGGKDVFTCDRIGDAIGIAAASAIQDMGTKSVLYVRDALRSGSGPASTGVVPAAASVVPAGTPATSAKPTP